MTARGAAWLMVVLCVGACGGAAPPAASPDAPAESADAKPPAADEAEAPPKSDNAAASDKPASSAPASDDDVIKILQLVVDDPELDNYLHLGQAGRFPLQIAGDKLPSGLKLIKATEPVKVV